MKLLDAPRDAEESCYIDSSVGVAAVLRAIAAAGTRTAAYIDGGDVFVPTTLLAVDLKPPALIFDKGPDDELNARLLQASSVTFVTADQGVPVQFSGPQPCVTSYAGFDAFCITVPHRVLRLQRRNYYRLPGEPVHIQLKCELVFPVDDQSIVLKPHVLDLSCGGLGAGMEAGEQELETGARASAGSSSRRSAQWSPQCKSGPRPEPSSLTQRTPCATGLNS